jgi:hypothetical protein
MIWTQICPDDKAERNAIELIYNSTGKAEAGSMSPIKTELLKALETASDDVVAQTFQYLQSILPEKAREVEPQTLLGNKFWEIQQRSIANGMTVLDESEIEQQLSGRADWVDRLRQNRAKLSTNGTQQTVIEMREEERF